MSVISIEETLRSNPGDPLDLAPGLLLIFIVRLIRGDSSLCGLKKKAKTSERRKPGTGSHRIARRPFGFSKQDTLMNTTKTIAVVLAIVTLVSAAGAQSLEKRYQVGLKLGMWDLTADAQVDGFDPSVSASVGNDGFIGGLSFGHWLTESLALEFSVAVMQTKFGTDIGILNVSTKASSVTAVLFGARQYFPRSTFDGSLRPFASVAVGPFTGSQSETRVGLGVVSESRTERAFGAQLGGGVDFILSRHFLAGIAVGYNLMSDFSQPIGGRTNYDGPVFSMEFSYLFGRGAR
jgi:outer membrane protein W